MELVGTGTEGKLRLVKDHEGFAEDEHLMTEYFLVNESLDWLLGAVQPLG